MNISQDFINAVAEKDLMMVHIMLKDSMVVDPTFKEFDTLLVYAENNLEELYDEHDGEVFANDLSAWTKDYLAEQMVNVVTNFSKERVEFLKNICKHLYSARAEKIENERRTENSQKIQVTRKQVGTGLAIAGVASAVVGIAISKPLVIGVGVAAAVAGGVLIVTDK